MADWAPSFDAFEELAGPEPQPQPAAKVVEEEDEEEEDEDEDEEEAKETANGTVAKKSEGAELDELRQENERLRARLNELSRLVEEEQRPVLRRDCPVWQRPLAHVQYHWLSTPMRRHLDKLLQGLADHGHVHPEAPMPPFHRGSDKRADRDAQRARGKVTYYESFCLDRLGLQGLTPVFQPAQWEAFDVPVTHSIA
eukprot:g8185.t1